MPTYYVWAELSDFFPEYSMEGRKKSNFTVETPDTHYLKVNLKREKSCRQ